jgi:hypothetical protein
MRDAVQEFKDFNRPFARRNAELMRFRIACMAAGPGRADPRSDA